MSIVFYEQRGAILKRFGRATFLLTIMLILFCATPSPYRFRHAYSVPQALRFVRQVLMDRGYRIAIFDPASGVIKTERKDHIAEDGSTVSYRISVMVVKPDELLIKILPASARQRTAQIMAPITESLQAMGFRMEHTSLSPPEP